MQQFPRIEGLQGEWDMSKFKSVARFKSVAHLASLAVAASIALGAGASNAAMMVGGAPMYPSRTIVQNGSKAKNLTTLVAAVKAAGLVDTLSGPGPFTVFAPTNAAFAKLPKGTVQNLLQPDQKSALADILTYHVVPGRLTKADLMAKIKAGGGSATLTTVEGKPLTVSSKMGRLYVTDAKGGMARIATADVMQSNGVVDVVNSVLMP
jgi:uncharacterized surface protein with fasciclin (FAS1) repeats